MPDTREIRVKVDGVTEGSQYRAGQQDRDERSEGVAESGLHAERGEEIERRIHAEHHEIALGEVDDPHDAEDQPEPDAHQAIDRADQKPGGQGLQKTFQCLGHRSPRAGRGVRWPGLGCRRRRSRFGHCFPRFYVRHCVIMMLVAAAAPPAQAGTVRR